MDLMGLAMFMEVVMPKLDDQPNYSYDFENMDYEK